MITRIRPGSAERRREEAARWFVTLQSTELSPRVLKIWKKWEAVTENRQVYDEIESVWSRTQDATRPESPTDTDIAGDAYDGALPVAAWRARNAADKKRSQRMIISAIGLAATVAAVAVALRILLPAQWPLMLVGGQMAVFETGVGEHEEIMLKDGSRIQLGARTAVTTNITDNSRTVVLDRGEAHFNVAHDKKRPFRVLAGGGTITAVGTAFNVRRRQDDHVVVTVTEGTVEIQPGLPPTQQAITHEPLEPLSTVAPQRLVHGQEITYDLAGRFSAPRLADEDIAITWRDGRLRYRGEPLRNVIPDVNRYSRRLLILGDRAAGEILYSGTVFERDVDDWIVGLERTFPELEVTVTDAQNVLIRTRSDVQQQPR